MLTERDKIKERVAAEKKADARRGVHRKHYVHKRSKTRSIIIHYTPGQSKKMRIDVTGMTIRQLQEYLANERRKAAIKIYE